MIICIVSPSLNHGGAERVASLWANGFVERGHDVFFVANIEDEVYSLGKEIHILPLTTPDGNKLSRYFGATRRLRKYFKTYHPDVIIGVMYACSLLAKIASLCLAIHVINTEHNALKRPEQQPMYYLDKIAKYYVNHLYDAITVLTEADLLVIKNRFKRVFVLPNPTFLTPLSSIPHKEKMIIACR